MHYIIFVNIFLYVLCTLDKIHVKIPVFLYISVILKNYTIPIPKQIIYNILIIQSNFVVTFGTIQFFEYKLHLIPNLPI